MDGMESMMEMMDFQSFRLKMKQEKTLYSFPLGYNISCKTSFLISLTKSKSR